jgi:excisionase family DNA binding protein
MDTTRQFVSVSEVAKILGVARLTIIHGIERGEIPAFNIGKKFLIKATWLEEKLQIGK